MANWFKSGLIWIQGSRARAAPPHIHSEPQTPKVSSDDPGVVLVSWMRVFSTTSPKNILHFIHQSGALAGPQGHSNGSCGIGSLSQATLGGVRINNGLVPRS